MEVRAWAWAQADAPGPHSPDPGPRRTPCAAIGASASLRPWRVPVSVGHSKQGGPAALSDSLQMTIRRAFCEIGRRVWQKDYVASNDGNFSYRLEENLVVATPTMVSKGFMQPEDMVLVDLEGRQVGGHRRLTSEIRIHLFIYRNRPDVRCVVHAHPPHAVAFAIARKPMPRCVLAEAEVNLGPVPIAPYATTGTWEFARTIEPWVRNHDAFLLASHGALVVGHDPFDAFYRLETLEQYARILMLARQLGGEPSTLDMAAMEDLLRLKERIGSADPRRHAGAPLCGTDVPPTPAAWHGATMKFEPFTGPIIDSPKPSPLSPPQAAGEFDRLSRPDIAEATREDMRRLGG